MNEDIDEQQAVRLKNKLHLLTFFITQCEEVDPLEEDENEWHPDFEEAVSAILFVNEHGYLEEEEMHELNDLYSKWSQRFEDLGLADKPPSQWREEKDIEDEIYELLEKYSNDSE